MPTLNFRRGQEFIMINAQSRLVLIASNLLQAIFQDFYLILRQIFKLNLEDHDVVKFDSVFSINLNKSKQLIINSLNERISFIELSLKLRTFVTHKFQILELLSFINKLITVVMNYNFLYEHAHKKQMQKLSQQNLRIKSILSESNKPKTSLKSNQILIKKLFLELKQYDDNQIISLATSLPILHSAKMIQMLKTIQQAKMMLQQQFDNGKYLRMSYEAKFVYFLWQVLGKEQTETLQLKRMIYLFYQKKGEQLKQILIEMAQNKSEAENLYEAWRMIKDDKLYYQHSYNKSNSNLNIQTITNQNALPLAPIPKRAARKKSNLIATHSAKSFDMENTTNKSLNQTSHRSIHQKLYTENFYEKRQLLKNQQKQRILKQQLEQCTFHPILQSRSKSRSKDKSIEVKGFDKTINRLVSGYNKTMQYKKSAQKYSRGEKYEQLKNKGMNPPKFLQRKKKENKYLFAINFEINNKKTLLRIKQNEKAHQAAKKLATIYGLNKNYEEQLKDLIQVQIENYNRNLQK